MSDKCPKCNGAGVLRDATQAWDCGQEPPVCDFCGGEGTWMAADSRLAQAHARIAELEAIVEKIRVDIIATTDRKCDPFCCQQISDELKDILGQAAEAAKEATDGRQSP